MMRVRRGIAAIFLVVWCAMLILAATVMRFPSWAEEQTVLLRASDLKGKWRGSFRQFSHDIHKSFPMRMEITSVEGDEFGGIMLWPDCATKIKGVCDGKEVWWTELEFIKGDSVLLHGIYKAEKSSGDLLAGDWLDPKQGCFRNKEGEFEGTPGGSFKLVRDSSIASLDVELDKLVDTKAAKDAYSKGGSLLMQKDYLGAIAELTRAINLGMNEAAPYRDRGTCYFMLKQYTEAEADVDQAIQLDSSNVAAAGDYELRGLVRIASGKFKDALADFLETYKQNPGSSKHSYIYHNIGTAYFRLGKYKLAVSYFDKAVAANRATGKTYFRRGKALEHLGLRDLAASDKEMARKMGYDENKDDN